MSLLKLLERARMARESGKTSPGGNGAGRTRPGFTDREGLVPERNAREHYMLGISLLREGRLQAARLEWQLCLSADPDQETAAEVRRQLARLDER